MIGMVLRWRYQIVNIKLIEHPQLKAYQHKPQTPKHVETTKVQIITRFDTSLEGS